MESLVILLMLLIIKSIYKPHSDLKVHFSHMNTYVTLREDINLFLFSLLFQYSVSSVTRLLFSADFCTTLPDI